MPHTQSAKKRLRQNEKRRLRNRAAKKGIKLQLRKFEETVKSGSPEQLQAEYNRAAQKLDKAAGKKVIHRNKAARKKAQLARMLKSKAPAKA
jgi:small subunit ribosomal protein S20